MLPLRYCPITIELELSDGETDPIIASVGDIPAAPGIAVETLGANTVSTSWKIDMVQVKVDVCTLDNALDNSYAQHLLSGKSLPIAYNTFISQIQATNQNEKILVNVSRAITRLKSIFVTFFKDGNTDRNRKFWNYFHSPMYPENKGDSLTFENDGEFEYQIQVGSKQFPEYPIRSHNEAYYQLAKTLGVQASSLHNFDISAREYRSTKFVLGTDCEKVLDAGFTGLNTRAGDLMSVRFEHKSGADATRKADRIHIVLHSDQIMEIRDSGIQVFD